MLVHKQDNSLYDVIFNREVIFFANEHDAVDACIKWLDLDMEDCN